MYYLYYIIILCSLYSLKSCTGGASLLDFTHTRTSSCREKQSSSLVTHQSQPVWALQCRWWAGFVVSGHGEECTSGGCRTGLSAAGTGTARKPKQTKRKTFFYRTNLDTFLYLKEKKQGGHIFHHTLDDFHVNHFCFNTCSPISLCLNLPKFCCATLNQQVSRAERCGTTYLSLW